MRGGPGPQGVGWEGSRHTTHPHLRAAQDFPEESRLAPHPEATVCSHPPPPGPTPQSSFAALVVLALGVYNPCLRLCFAGTLAETEVGALGSGWGDTGEASQGWSHCCGSAPIRDCGVREGVDSWTPPSKSPLHCAWALGGNWNAERGPDGRLKDYGDASCQGWVWQAQRGLTLWTPAPRLGGEPRSLPPDVQRSKRRVGPGKIELPSG